MASIRKPSPYQSVQGIFFPTSFSPKCFAEALAYKPRPDDVIICTYPRSGTTWMQFLVLHIFRKGVTLDSIEQFRLASPFLDMLGEDGMARMLRPGAIKTHLPFTHVPYSSEAKYIYVARNPFDTCVSLYHHTFMMPWSGYWDGDFDDFFELFMAGEVEFNDYFDHLLSWYPHLKDKNVYYTTYEDMKKDTKSIVHQLARFIGNEYVDAIEKDNSVLNNILHHCSFENMKQSFENLYSLSSLKSKIQNRSDEPEGLQYARNYENSNLLLKDPERLPKKDFIRKGVVGGWKEYFSPSQEERLKKKFDAKTEGIDVKLLWP